MDRRRFLLGLFGGLAVAPAVMAAGSSVDAAPLTGTLHPAPGPLAGSASGLTSDPVRADWTQADVAVPPAARRRVRRGARRMESLLLPLRACFGIHGPRARCA